MRGGTELQFFVYSIKLKVHLYLNYSDQSGILKSHCVQTSGYSSGKRYSNFCYTLNKIYNLQFYSELFLKEIAFFKKIR